MGPVSVRPGTEDDVPLLSKIEEEVQVSPWTTNNFQEELKKPHSKTLVITDDETDSVISAYVVYWILNDECQILNLAVKADQRRKGLARMLVGKVVNEAIDKSAVKVTLDVRKSNEPAVQLYQSLSFTIQGIRKAFYSDGEDAYTMAVALNSAPDNF